ncbi:hypothetical protein ACFL27_13865 [candidate division CSSED10-310 bacterium]|uniref:Ferric oxidoreductase domain-containing protein n=1 Tax=candidate division CSSED10-310 bacterium TaxID=2855610 RepID=A0ABV6YYZ0_UNCC1
MKKWFQSLIVSLSCLFAATAVYANGNGHEHQEGFEVEYIIIALGVTTLLSLITTALLGYFMPKNRKLIFPWHKRMAIVTVIAAFSHAMMILIFD